MLLFLLYGMVVTGHAQVTDSVASRQRELRHVMGIPSIDSLLNKTHVERFALLHGFYGNNNRVQSLDTVEVASLFAELNRTASKQKDKGLIRELRCMKVRFQTISLSKERRIVVYENYFNEA